MCLLSKSAFFFLFHAFNKTCPIKKGGANELVGFCFSTFEKLKQKSKFDLGKYQKILAISFFRF
jgi:hypothetical protein